ncbi:MAG: tRNA (cytidine(34)-2'-O)-methyltransferase [Clostridia bacterium]|nr:tRNA (cytidine(34)-2'-O)-methyltransferase [Clostridia bacterium]
MSINVVLVEPEIPENAGNIARTCAAIGAKLHLVKPYGFDISEQSVKRNMKRAGLDYWDKVSITEYENLDDFKSKVQTDNFYLLSTKSQNCYTNVSYTDDCYIIFGAETRGLPESYLLENMEHAVRIPMREGIRSLNLSNSVAIVAYEVERQLNFANLQEISHYFN